MMPYIIGGFVGFAIGAAFQRIVIYFAVDTINPTMCDLCKWRKENQGRWVKKMDRHKK